MSVISRLAGATAAGCTARVLGAGGSGGIAGLSEAAVSAV
jgi:hypothetical protein